MSIKHRLLSVFLIGLCLVIHAGCDQKNNQAVQTEQNQQPYSKADRAALEAKSFKYLNISCEQVIARLTEKGFGKDKASFYMGEETTVSRKPRMQCVLLYNKEMLQLHGLTGISLYGDYKSITNLTKIDFNFNVKDKNLPAVRAIIKDLFSLIKISDVDAGKVIQLMWAPEIENGRRKFAQIVEINGYEIAYTPLGRTVGFSIEKL